LGLAGGTALIIRRLIVPLGVAIVTVCAGQAFAQGAFPAPLPGQAPTKNDSVFPPVNGAAPLANTGLERAPAPLSQGAADDCMKEFTPLREEVGKRGKAVKVATEQHAPPEEACKLLGNFSQAELKMIDYVESHAAKCGIPPQTADQLKSAHTNTENLQKRVCQVAQQAAPKGPAGIWTTISKAPPPAPPAVAEAPHTATGVITSAAPVATSDHRIALVIGNSAYQNVPALANPERDAKLVADVLKRTGFESVTLLTNLKKDALVSALRTFAVQAETADWAIIYYAGHGMEVGGTNYLIPVDASIAADRDIGFEAVPLEQVLNAAERAKKLRLVILDACRDNPFKAQMKRTLVVASRSVSGGLAAIEPEAGTLVVYAAKDGQQASDGDGIDSPFTLAFVKNVQTPGLEVRRLFDFVRDDVMDVTNRRQQPFSYGSISGRQDFYFVGAK
jgi:hypothetical protein